jgi:hypothetical protein
MNFDAASPITTLVITPLCKACVVVPLEKVVKLTELTEFNVKKLKNYLVNLRSENDMEAIIKNIDPDILNILKYRFV